MSVVMWMIFKLSTLVCNELVLRGDQLLLVGLPDSPLAYLPCPLWLCLETTRIGTKLASLISQQTVSRIEVAQICQPLVCSLTMRNIPCILNNLCVNSRK